MTDIDSKLLRFCEVPATPGRGQEFSAREHAILDAVNLKVGARESLEQILDFLAESLQKISPCDRFSLAFVEEPGQRVVSYYTHAEYEPVLLTKGYAEDLAKSSLQVVLRRGVPRIITDLKRYLRLRPESACTKLLVREGVCSSMTCPLRVDGRIVGLLFRSARQPDAYNDHQVHLHLAIAERLGQAVEKTYRITQLAEANHAYFEMLGFVAHELKNPLGSMLTEAGLLYDGYLGELEPKQREHIEKMVAKGKFLLSLIDDYLDLSRIEGQGQKLDVEREVDFIADVVEPAIGVIQAQMDSKGMRLLRDFPTVFPHVEVDPHLLRIVLVNLLGNGVKYGFENGQIRVTVAHGGDHFTVYVWNEGAGFPAHQKHRLFRKFSRLQTPELLKQKGTGLGLYTSWRIVRMHGGGMQATSEQGKWAGFSFEIPQPLNQQGEPPE